MITGFQHMHSAFALGRPCFIGAHAHQGMGKIETEHSLLGQGKLGLFTMISLHVQLLLGLALYMMKGWMSMLGYTWRHGINGDALFLRVEAPCGHDHWYFIWHTRAQFGQTR